MGCLDCMPSAANSYVIMGPSPRWRSLEMIGDIGAKMVSGKNVQVLFTSAIYTCLGLPANWGAVAEGKAKGSGS